MSSDETLLDDVDPRVRIERVPLPMHHLEQDLRRFGSFRVNHPELPRQQLISLTGHKSPGSITACRRRMRQVGLF